MFGAAGRGVEDTLLGPEGTTCPGGVGVLDGDSSSDCRAAPGGVLVVVVVGGVVVGCVFVENCTVDASIFCDLCGQVAEGTW